jgi:hypothetical protein
MILQQPTRKESLKYVSHFERLYHVSSANHRAADDNFPRSPIVPIRDDTFLEIDKPVRLSSPVRRHSDPELFSREIVLLLASAVYLAQYFLFGSLTRMSKNESIFPSSSKFDQELRGTIIHDFSFRDWRVLFCVLPNLIEDLPFTISIEGGVFSSLSGLVQPLL